VSRSARSHALGASEPRPLFIAGDPRRTRSAWIPDEGDGSGHLATPATTPRKTMTDNTARIWIDADACPRDVKDLVYRAAERLRVPVMVVANKYMALPSSPLLTMVPVAGGPDVADDHIVAHALASDLAITADIPLAARLVPKGVIVLNPRGEEYDAENIGERLSVRDFLTEARDLGIVTGGPSAWGPKDKQRFANALDRALFRMSKVGRG